MSFKDKHAAKAQEPSSFFYAFLRVSYAGQRSKSAPKSLHGGGLGLHRKRRNFFKSTQAAFDKAEKLHFEDQFDARADALFELDDFYDSSDKEQFNKCLFANRAHKQRAHELNELVKQPAPSQAEPPPNKPPGISAGSQQESQAGARLGAPIIDDNFFD